jgi:hypothetical protein
MSAPLLAAIDDARLRTVAARWWQCRGEYAVPYWRHMPRDVLQPLLPAVLLYRHAPAKGSFRVETLTDDLSGLTRLRVGGKLIEDVLPADLADDVRERFLSVIGGPAAVVVKVADRADPARGAVEERVLLPLRSGGRGAPDLILGAFTRLDPDAAGWLPFTQNVLSVARLPVAELAQAAAAG